MCLLSGLAPGRNAFNLPVDPRNQTGINGVSFDKRTRNYLTRIGVNNKRIHLGRFNTLEKAKEVRVEAEKKYYGEFGPNVN